MGHHDAPDSNDTTVPLGQYAAIKAALAEPFPLVAVLAVENIDEREWIAAEMTWRQRLAADPALFRTYQSELVKAEDRLARRITPFEADVFAWASLTAAIGAAKDPTQELERVGLGVNDMARLVRRWTRQFEIDDSLRRKMANAPKKLDQPPVAVAEPRRLIPSGIVRSKPTRATKSVYQDDPDLERNASIEWLDEAAVVMDPDPVVVPDDRYIKAAEAKVAVEPNAGLSFGGTIELRGGGGPGIDLPFWDAPPNHIVVNTPFAPKSPSPFAGETGELPENDDAATHPSKSPTDAIPFELESVSIGGFTVRQYAYLCAELALSPAGASMTPARFGLADDNARAKLADAWGRRFQQQPELRDVWANLCSYITRQPAKATPNFGQTAPVDERSVAARTTPFKEGIPKVLSVPKTLEPLAANAGATLDIHGGAQAIPATPFVAQETMELPSCDAPPAPVPTALPDVVIMGFNVQQYASLCAELAVSNGQTAPILARYRVPNEAARAQLAEAWGVRMTQQPELRQTWIQLCNEYRTWLLSAARNR